VATSLPASSVDQERSESTVLPATRAGQFGWALFDWANSPFAVLIITFVFPAYFAAAIVGDQVRGQAIWGYAIGASGLAVALLSAPLGAIADAGGRRKPWILAFAIVGMVATALLWFATPSRASMSLALLCVAIANIAVALDTMFTNAMLPDIVTRERLGRLSGWAWGLGYIGGLAALGVALIAFIQPATPLLGLDREKAEHVRIVGPLVTVWLGLFMWPLFVMTPDRPGRRLPVAAALGEGLRNLRRTLQDLGKDRELALFLLANMLYADGLATLFAFGGVYVSGTFGMSLSEVIVFGVVLNVSAGFGAFFFGWVDDWIGSRRTTALALAGLIAASVAAVSVETRPWLWVTNCFIGIFVGPVQAASRSLMARLSPPDRQAEYFGLFALSGKATAFAGPIIVAVVTDVSGSQRTGMATIIFFLAAGLVLLGMSGLRARAATMKGTGDGD
jgi:UMF1 family MFS transporter